MSDLLRVQAVVLSSAPVGEYDKRVVLLTRERGKISAFAKGARRPGSPFMAACNPFVFGDFLVYEGRSSYNLNQVTIRHHFGNLATLQPEVYYGYYFLELADYFGHEGTDEKQMMNLLYVAVRALTERKMDNRLIRSCFELRTMAEQGLAPRLYECGACGKDLSSSEAKAFFSLNANGLICEACAKRFSSRGEEGGRSDLMRISVLCLAAMRYACTAPLGRLFSFRLPEENLKELEHISYRYLSRAVDKKIKSLQILEIMAK